MFAQVNSSNRVIVKPKEKPTTVQRTSRRILNTVEEKFISDDDTGTHFMSQGDTIAESIKKSEDIIETKRSRSKTIDYIVSDFHCKECDRYFISEKYLSTHMEYHNPQDIYECFLCGVSLRGTHKHFLWHVRKCIIGKEYVLQEKIKSGVVVFNQLYYERQKSNGVIHYTCVVCPRKVSIYIFFIYCCFVYMYRDEIQIKD